MIKVLFLTLFLVLSLASSGFAETSVGLGVSSGGDVSFSLFYSDLEPYGRWIAYEPYGQVWTPTTVAAGWRPYSHGNWVYTDYGWSWVSYEPYGWATYHYGRWFYEPGYGWLWAPDNVWAPSWVAWHYDDDVIGWAPLPPAAAWGPSGFKVKKAKVMVGAWSFVPKGHFLAQDLRYRILPASQNAHLVAETRNGTGFKVKNGSPVNHGIKPGKVEKLTGQKITQLAVSDADAPGRAKIKGNVASFYRPQVQKSVGAGDGPRATSPGKREQPGQVKSRDIRPEKAGMQGRGPERRPDKANQKGQPSGQGKGSKKQSGGKGKGGG